jgi:hypothetical protein
MKENMRAALAGAVRAQLAKDLIPEMSDYGAEVNCEVPVVKGRKVCHPDAMMCLACQKDVAQETCPHCGAAAVRHVSAVVRTGERVSTKCFPQAPTYGLRTRLEYMITLIRQQRFGKLLDEATRGGKWVRELAK